MHYYDEGKPQNLRPTLERINSDIGYVKGNIDILAYKENVQNAAGIPCIALEYLQSLRVSVSKV